MRDSIGTIREFETEQFKVVIEALIEDDLDLSWDDSGEIVNKLESGDLIAFCAHSYVLHKPTGAILGEDYLGDCIYKSLRDFADHRECARQNRHRIRRYGRYQIYRKNRPYEHCLRESDKLRKRGFSTRDKAESWAKENTHEAYEVFESGKCGSYFSDMIAQCIAEARKQLSAMHDVYVRT